MQRTVTHTWLPLGVLQALHALKVHDVRIGPLNAKGLQAMQVEQQVVLGGTLGNLVGRTDNLLVVAVEEVHLKALDAHRGIVLEDGLSVEH